jgi:hypothetical protein
MQTIVCSIPTVQNPSKSTPEKMRNQKGRPTGGRAAEAQLAFGLLLEDERVG